MSAWAWIVSALPFEWAHFTFMQNALLTVLIAAPLFALLGCVVVNNQMAFFSDAIGHAGLTGIAIAALLGMANPLWAMVGLSLVLAVGMTYLRRYSAASSDTVVGIVMSFTVALGIVLLSRGGAFSKYSGFLIGDLLSIAPEEIALLACVAALFMMLWVSHFNRIFLVSLNASLARSRKMNVWFVHGLFACITAVIVTVSIQWVGILVINALLVLPATTSRNMARSMKEYLWFAVMVSLLSAVAGLLASYYWATAAGATIVLFAMVLYCLSVVVGGIRGR